MTRMNRIANCGNRFQGTRKKVLCVCSAGLLRSPSAAVVLCQEPFNFNTRAAGISLEYALIPVDEVLLTWADEVVCMEDWQASDVKRIMTAQGIDIPVIVLNVEDRFEYMNPELVQQIKDGYAKAEAAGQTLRNSG